MQLTSIVCGLYLVYITCGVNLVIVFYDYVLDV